MRHILITTILTSCLIVGTQAAAQEAAPFDPNAAYIPPASQHTLQPTTEAVIEAPAPSPLEQDIAALQHDWAHIKYELTDEDMQERQMEALAKQATAVTAQYPYAAEPKIWEAIILSSQAGIKGGLGALDLVEQARDLLLAAEKIDGNALDGSAYTSLGSLYYKVPGWPLGFGDSSKARAYLEQARAINPSGIDPNYFYGDFLIEQGEYQKAIQMLEQALQAPPRPNRPVADAGRRKEIQVALTKANAKLGQ